MRNAQHCTICVYGTVSGVGKVIAPRDGETPDVFVCQDCLDRLDDAELIEVKDGEIVKP